MKAVQKVRAYLSRRRRRSAIRLCLSVVPRKLKADYRRKGPFTAAEVTETLGRAGLSMEPYAQYAYAMFCYPDAAPLPPGLNLPALRQDVADMCFGGHDYTPGHMIAYCSQHGARRRNGAGGDGGGDLFEADSSDGGWFGGGDSGGGDGGGGGD